mmetsp:Transcript_18065/g.63935  ORF Transcript_18065/g.63935 Transcript_18065/m.63935 type:complete len:105 (-) Transcript_18065:50-364(-)
MAEAGAMSAELRKVMSKPLVKSVDMTAEQSSEAVEIVTMAVDKYAATANYEKAAQLIKDTMDKKFGSTWHVCIGEGFGFEVTYQARNLLYLYYAAKLGVLVFKC